MARLRKKPNPVPDQNSRAEVLGRAAQYTPTPEALETITATREAFTELLDYLWSTLPAGREKSAALTHVEEAQMWANKATSRANQDPAAGAAK